MTSTSAPLLSVRHLHTQFISVDGTVARALEDVSFDVWPGQTLGLVGESGCGKSTTLFSMMRLLPAAGRITGGQVLFDGIDLLTLSEREMREYRWKHMAMVFQSAMNALNPVYTVGHQIREAILLHEPVDKAAADKRTDDLLDLVGIATSRKEQYPHQYSGGMRQRAMIAMALACQPRLLFADEPTTALDVMVQAQVLELLKKIQRELGLALVLVTHDLGVVAEACDAVVVMYGGKVAEYGSTDAVYNAPQHPYTQKFLEAFPDLNVPGENLASIPGHPPRLNNLPPGCRFEPRCHKRIDVCASVAPKLIDVSSVKDEGGRMKDDPTVFRPLPSAFKHLAACHLCTGPEATF
ncbi:MAG: ABC transporter ATP-binding protein [Anaerolineales bacterium]|nr:ABC transporter ATP-binding protein [Anaerolineales bacterium]